MPLAHARDLTPAVERAIGSSMSSGVRRHLIEDGTWDAVRAQLLARDPDASAWIDVGVRGPWFPVERHLAIMRALHDVAGDEGVRALGQRRLHESLTAGILGPLLRSWGRSYAGAPAQLLRVAPHAWSAATRNLGTMVITSMGDRVMGIEVRQAPEIVRRCDPWHRFLEGYGLGVLEMGMLDGEVAIATSDDALVGTFRWR